MHHPSLPKSYKKMFPFKLATTSYIYPDRIVPNVSRLAPFLDEIELVLFESDGQDALPDEGEIKALIHLASLQEVKYNIHLPIDISLGDGSEEVRSRAVSVVRRTIERTLSLNPSVYTLHFELSGENDRGKDLKPWHKQALRSAEEILDCGIEPNRISIETLGYPFDWIEDIVRKFGFSICLDIGHILIHGLDLRLYLEKYLFDAPVVHLHGLQNGLDHQGVDQLPEPTLELILSRLRHYHGIVSIEVFSIHNLERSLILLEEKWGKS